MEKSNAVAALGALAQDNRLDVYRLLVQAGLDGLPAGQVSAKLDLAPNTLTFHFDRLRAAGLITVRRDRRQLICSPPHDPVNALLSYLTQHCCEGRADKCRRTKVKTISPTSSLIKRRTTGGSIAFTRMPMKASTAP